MLICIFATYCNALVHGQMFLVKISILVRYKMQTVSLFCNKNVPDEPSTLLKIKVLQMVLHSDAIRTIFGSTKNHSVKGSLKNHLFIIWRTFFRHKEAFVKQKGSSDIKGSLWKNLDKKVLLWHREAPLFLRVYLIPNNNIWQE